MLDCSPHVGGVGGDGLCTRLRLRDMEVGMLDVLAGSILVERQVRRAGMLELLSLSVLSSTCLGWRR